MKRPTTATLCLATAVALGGCGRTADDRVDGLQPDLWQERAIGNAVVAYRPTRQARLSGNTVILTDGWEPVHVRPAARVAVSDQRLSTTEVEAAKVLERLADIDERLQRQEAAAERARERSETQP